jgi:predicted nucleic acid-binding protein
VKVLDTSVAIDHLRGDVQAMALLSQLVQMDEPIVASEVVRFELLAGVREEERDGLEQFFSVLYWIPVDEGIARMAGSLAGQFRRSHSGIDSADYLIAATALVMEADLLTQNVRHFPMMVGLAPAY